MTTKRGVEFIHRLNLRELSAVLAGLRLVQQQLAPVPGGQNVSDILDDGGSIEPLSVEEISELCERLNFGEE